MISMSDRHGHGATLLMREFPPSATTSTERLTGPCRQIGAEVGSHQGGTMTEAPMPAAELTPRQAERYDRMLDMAIQLASEGGYEAVQMRDVAVNADVALGTLYRYFVSKDQLLAAAWTHWAARIEPGLTRRPLQGATMAERATDFLHRATRAFEREPRLAAALLTAAASTDYDAMAPQHETADLVNRILLSVLTPLESQVADGVRQILNHVWNSALREWINGRSSIADVYAILEGACHLLLDPREP